MKIKIEGNPGTGNTFQEINIQHVDNFNPNATTVNNNYYGTRERRTPTSNANPNNSHDDVRELSVIREEILKYVSRLSGQVANEWKSRYMNIWGEILELEIVADKIYEPGKQQGTNFNRNLVANIIHYLNNKNIFREYVPAHISALLEGSSDHSVRGELGKDPSDDAIVSRLNRYFE